MAPGEFHWPNLESPEAAAIWAADPLISREQALEIGLAAEMAGLGYYKNIFETTTDPEIKILAKQFIEEESGHVAALEKSIALYNATARG
jgi:rubrerythrin